MAQNSVHVTQTLQAKPSIFELVAADSLQSTFYPALKRIANVRHILNAHQGNFFTFRFLFQFLVNSNPAKYGWLSQYYDEVYLCLNALIQQHYIRCYGKIQLKQLLLKKKLNLIVIYCRRVIGRGILQFVSSS